MSFETYRHDLAAVIRFRALEAWARARGESAPAMPGPLREAREDLVSAAGLDAVEKTVGDVPAGSREAWIRVPVAREVARARTRELTVAVESEIAALRWNDGRHTPWHEMEWRLATVRGHAERNRMGQGLVEACSVASDMSAELGAARREVEPVFRSSPSVEAAARDRQAEWVLALGRGLLRSTDERFERDCADARRALGMPPGRGRAIDLPWFRAGGDAAFEMPEPDASLVAHVVEGLSLRTGLEGRLDVLFQAPEARPLAGVWILEPGREVYVVGSRVAVAGDYRSLLGATGEGLSAALSEVGDPLDRWLVDPAIGCLYRALFESLGHDATWVEAATRRPAPPGWVQQGRLLSCLRMRELAVSVMNGEDIAGDDLPAHVPTEQMARATGFDAPAPVTPWSVTAGRAADEMVGRLAAPLVADHLAGRWGRGWFTSAAAGALLRDLWATPHDTLGALLRDLGLGDVSADAWLEEHF